MYPFLSLNSLNRYEIKIQSLLDASWLGLFEKVDTLPGFYMGRYEGKSEYDESFFQVKDENEHKIDN